MITQPSFYTHADSQNELSKFLFAIRQYMVGVRTASLAQVVSCTNNGELSQVGTLVIQLIVDQVNGDGNITALPKVFRVPYVRIQGGNNAVIIDPAPGDIGIVVFGDRDLSAVISTKAQAAPGSGRRHSLSDALWIGGILNAAPTQYVQFNASGMTIVSPQAVMIQAPSIKLSGNVEVTGTTKLDGAVTGGSTANFDGEGTFNGHTVGEHTHISESPGTPTSQPTG